MCGICVWASRRSDVDGKRLSDAIELLRHRGPDSQNLMLWNPGGSFVCPAGRVPESKQRGAQVGLAHARLSIIDLSKENDQPFFSEDGQCSLVYNGEIYNYIELRDGLGDPPLRTAGDTEVLLRLLMRDGRKAVRSLNGMWAFAYFDAQRKKILISRDRFGKKPLFFYHDEDQFIVASEYKALFEMLGQERRVSPEYIYGFLMGKRWPVFSSLASMYQGVSIVPPGACLEYDLETNQLEIFENNSVESFIESKRNPASLHREMAADIHSAVNLRLRSDVPVGVMVSGGVDSTAVAAIAAASEAKANISFYTIDVNDPEDLFYSRKVAEQLGVNLVQVRSDLENDEMEEVLGYLTKQFEVPINVALVTLPGYLVCRKMAQDGIRVVLDGTGGDEMLGGYPGYYQLALENSMRAQKVSQAYRLKRMVDQREDLQTHSFMSGWFRFFRRTAFPGRRPPEKMITDSRAELFGRHARHAELERLREVIDECFGRDRMTDVEAMQLFDLVKGQMPYYLYINDQVSMLNSVESRSPFLDYRLIKYLRMNDRYKFRNGYNKYQLRKSIPASISDDVRWRKSKAGFGLTPEKYYRECRGNMLAEVRDSQVLRGLFDMDAMLAEIESRQNQSHFKEMIAHLHSIAMLEAQVPMTV